VALLVVRAATAESRDEAAPPGIDLAGVATTGGAAFALLYALTAGQTRGFGDPLVLALFAAAVVLAVLFVLSSGGSPTRWSTWPCSNAVASTPP
jgi:hypothetical protein